jgi:hypothetical protein
MLPRELRRGSIEANFQVGRLELLVVPPAATLGLTGRESFPAGVFQRGMSIILNVHTQYIEWRGHYCAPDIVFFSFFGLIFIPSFAR